MKKILLPFVLLTLLITACKKKDSTVSNPTNTNNFKTYASMDEVFALLALQPKVMTFDAQAGSSFYGSSGTRFIFEPNSFQYANGDTVTGNVQIEVTEWRKKGDMIFSGMLPLSDGQALVSGGELSVKATKNGTEVFLRQGYPMRANVPHLGSKDTTMSLFKGNTTGGTSANKVNWLLAKVDTPHTIPTTTVVPTPGPRPPVPNYIYNHEDTFKIICDTCTHWNCDHFLTKGNLQVFTVKVVATGKEISSGSNLCAYTLFDNVNALIPLQSTTTKYDVDYIPKIAVHFVSFGLIDGHFYAGVASATATTGQTYTITLTEVDPADFKAQINGLY